MEKKNLNMKQNFVLCLLLVICFVTMTRYFNVERGYLERASNSSAEYSGIFIESYSESPIRPENSIDLKLSGKLSHFKDSNRNTRQRHTSSKCGYDNCPKIKKGSINIHLISHSHDDPGYKKTADEYFYGLRNDIHNFSVSKILDSVIPQLTLNKDRKFSYAEVVFFSKWWKLQTESTRKTVRELVENGRIEFINGGWCVNDEATTNYADIIDQMSLGLNFLAETFGDCGRPKVAMVGDAFGHSREQAVLNSLMGFDALFIGRLDKEDKDRRIDALEIEMIWSGSDLPGKHPSIFTGIQYNLYQPPGGFCFENLCSDLTASDPINDDVHSKNYDVQERANKFLDYCWRQADAHKTNNIVVYMGGDYSYQYAELWYTSIDKLIKNINERQKDGSPFNIFYSTLACYAKALNEADVSWPTKKDDFFPFHGDYPIYWTGFYSSRPALKYMIRQGSSFLKSCKQIASILKLKGAEDKGDLSVMKEAMAVVQHHDGITGTHSQRVDDDYVNMIHKGVDECTKTMNSYYQAELPRNEKDKESKFTVSYCHQLNISQCDATAWKGDSFIVNVYNPLGKYMRKYIRVPVSQEYDGKFYRFRVIGSDGHSLPSELMPIPRFVASIPGRNSSANHELIFMTTNVPPLGSKSYYIEASLSGKPSTVVPFWNSSNPSNQVADVNISNKKLSITVCKDTGLVSSVTLNNKKKISLDQQFFWYNGNGINCTLDSTVASGVYAFNPLEDAALRMNLGTKNITVYKGDIVEEIHQTVNEYVGQIIRLYKNQDYIEFDWVIGPVPIDDGVGKEIITRYTTDFENNGIFHTDSNGRQSILRTRNKRQTYTLEGNEPVASNYYPITSHAFITDSKSGYRMNVLTDRAQGGGSIKDGEFELMIHRRFVGQDHCIFYQPLDEMAHGEGLVVRGTHVLFFENTKDGEKNNSGSSTLRSAVQERSWEPVISQISTNYTHDQWIRLYRSKLEFLSRPLPENVRLLTFEPRPGSKQEYILRLEHIYDVGEHLVLSNTTEISLKGLFMGFDIEDIEETTLDGNLMKSDLKRLKWKSNDEDVDGSFDYHSPSKSMDRIQLMPMEIRTFIIRLLASKQDPLLVSTSWN